MPLEREWELGALREAVDAACASVGRIIVLEGAPGLGKTHLLTHATRHAQEQGMVVLRARGGELERQYPFGVALQLFEPYLSNATPRERSRVLAGAAAHAEPALTGKVRLQDASGPPEFPLLHGLHWVAANIAEQRPLMLAVDDAQAADDASMRALLYTAQRSEDLPLLIVVTTRPRQSGGDALATLATHPLVQRRQLLPLSTEATAALVRTDVARGRRPLLRRLLGADPGQPLLHARADRRAGAVRHRAGRRQRRQALTGLGPVTIERATAGRLERLAPGAAPLARAVAVLGDDAPLAQAADARRAVAGAGARRRRRAGRCRRA